MKQTKRGFTLIELLVVIAIIGILSSIVLASLNSARQKGNDAKVKGQMASIRSGAELYNNGAGGYATTTSVITCTISSSTADCTGSGAYMMTDTTYSGMKTLMQYANYPVGTTVYSNVSSNGYAVAASLSSGYWCIDSTGVVRGTNSAGSAYTAVGPGTGTNAIASGAVVCN